MLLERCGQGLECSIVAQQVGHKGRLLAFAPFLVEQHIHHVLPLLGERVALGHARFGLLLGLLYFLVAGHCHLECGSQLCFPVFHIV